MKRFKGSHSTIMTIFLAGMELANLGLGIHDVYISAIFLGWVILDITVKAIWG